MLGRGLFFVGLPQLPKQWVAKLEKMTARQLIFLALGISVLLSTAIYMQLSSMEETQNKAAQEMVTVVVAAKDIPAKTQIRAEMLKTIAMPADLVPPNALTDINALLGKFSKVDILAEDIVTDKKFFEDARLSGFRGMIPADMRAISLSITDITGISGLAKPGDKVDVIFVSDKLYKNAVSSEMLLQNVLLLALNKDSEAGTDVNSSVKSPTEGLPVKKESGQMVTATLAVTAEEAVRLAGIQSQGTIFLALRPYEPKDGFLLIPPKVVPLEGNNGGTPVMAQTPLPGNTAAAPPPQAYVSPQASSPAVQVREESPSSQETIAASDTDGIEVIRGNTVSREKIR